MNKLHFYPLIQNGLIPNLKCSSLLTIGLHGPKHNRVFFGTSIIRHTINADLLWYEKVHIFIDDYCAHHQMGYTRDAFVRSTIRKVEMHIMDSDSYDEAIPKNVIFHYNQNDPAIQYKIDEISKVMEKYMGFDCSYDYPGNRDTIMRLNLKHEIMQSIDSEFKYFTYGDCGGKVVFRYYPGSSKLNNGYGFWAIAAIPFEINNTRELEKYPSDLVSWEDFLIS